MSSLTRRNFLALGPVAAIWQLSEPRRSWAAAPAWVDRRTDGPFQTVAAFPLGGFDPVFADLGRLEHELERTLAVPAAEGPLEVFLFADEASHREYLGQLFPRVPYRRALYVQRSGHGAVYAFRHEELPIDLRHECTHALLHSCLAMLPLWLDEGLAEYFEMPENERAFGHPHLTTLKWNLRLGMVKSVETLESKQDLGEMEGVDYRFSWAWVHFMLHGPLAAHRALVEYLADIRRGQPPGKLSQRLRTAMPDVDTRMVQHFKRWRKAA
jgi:hypothetical protein